MENDPIFHAILLAKRMARGGYADGGDTSDPIAYANSLLGYGDAASQSSLNNSGLPTSLPMGIAPSVAKPSAMQTPGTPSSVQPDISGLSAPAAGQAAPSVAAGPAAPTPSTPAPTPTPAAGKPAAKKDETTSTNTQKRGGRVGYYDGGLIDLDTPVPSTQQNIGLYGIDWGNPDSSADFFRADQQLQKALAVSNQILNGNSDVDSNTNPRLIPPEVIPNPTPNNVPLPPVRPSNLGDETTDTSTQAPPASAPQGGSTVPPPQNVNVKGVDPRLIDIYNEASKSLPEGYSVQLTSGYRAGDPRFHGQGKAVDFQITDANGNVLNNYQNLPAFRTYEQFAQSARKAQMQMYPELNDQLRWGGYFSGKTHPFGGPYGAVDIMHLDLGGDKVGMQGGSWAGGLTDAQRKLLQNKAISQGMGQGYASGGTPEADLSNQDKIVRDALLTANSMPKEDLFSGNLNQYNTNATLSDGNLSASFGSVNPIEQSSGASLYPMFNTTLGAQLSPKFNTSFTRQTPLSNSQSGSSNIASFGYNDSDISSNAQFGDTPSGRMYGATFGKNDADSNLNLFGNYTPKTHNFTGGVEYSKRFASGGMVDHALRKAYATDGTVTDPADTPTAGDYQPTGDPELDTALQQISDAKKEMNKLQTPPPSPEPLSDSSPYNPYNIPQFTNPEKPVDPTKGYQMPLGERVSEGISTGFGSDRLGLSAENQQKYDPTGFIQTFAAPADFLMRAPNAIVGGASAFGAGLYGQLSGSDDSEVNRLQRDLNIMGTGATIESAKAPEIAEPLNLSKNAIVDTALSKMPDYDPNTLRIFAGGLSDTSDLDALDQANRLKNAGKDREEIIDKTGWFKGADNKWRYEIPDYDAQLNNETHNNLIRLQSLGGFHNVEDNLGNLFYHPELYRAYPEVQDMKVKLFDPIGHLENVDGYFDPIKNEIGMSSALTDPDKFKSTLVHEIQHKVQNMEGFEPGGNLNQFKGKNVPNPDYNNYKQLISINPDYQEFFAMQKNPEIQKNMLNFMDDYDKLWNENYKDEISKRMGEPYKNFFQVPKEIYDSVSSDFEKQAMSKYPNIQKYMGLKKLFLENGFPVYVPDETLSPSDAYQRLSGEIESRNIQKRAYLTPEELKTRRPWDTQFYEHNRHLYQLPEETGYAKGGTVVNQALSVLSKYGSTLPDADVILRQLKRGRP